MEPAGQRPDDMAGMPGTAGDGSPQWGRPLNGRIWAYRQDGMNATTQLQWSRPVIGRVTSVSGWPLPRFVQLPAMDRPLNGRMTYPVDFSYDDAIEAAMEPAAERPDDPRTHP